jgi:hypothetical protein
MRATSCRIVKAEACVGRGRNGQPQAVSGGSGDACQEIGWVCANACCKLLPDDEAADRLWQCVTLRETVLPSRSAEATTARPDLSAVSLRGAAVSPRGASGGNALRECEQIVRVVGAFDADQASQVRAVVGTLPVLESGIYEVLVGVRGRV